jgi:hypothetical protein
LVKQKPGGVVRDPGFDGPPAWSAGPARISVWHALTRATGSIVVEHIDTSWQTDTIVDSPAC